MGTLVYVQHVAEGIVLIIKVVNLTQLGKTYLGNVLCKKYGVERVVTVTIGDLAIMYPGDLLKGLTTYLGSSRQFSKTVGRRGGLWTCSFKAIYIGMTVHDWILT